MELIKYFIIAMVCITIANYVCDDEDQTQEDKSKTTMVEHFNDNYPNTGSQKIAKLHHGYNAEQRSHPNHHFNILGDSFKTK